MKQRIRLWLFGGVRFDSGGFTLVPHGTRMGSAVSDDLYEIFAPPVWRIELWLRWFFTKRSNPHGWATMTCGVQTLRVRMVQKAPVNHVIGITPEQSQRIEERARQRLVGGVGRR